MPPTGIWIGWVTLVTATLVLRFTTIALLRRMREAHTVMWSSFNLPEPETQRRPFHAPGVDLCMQRFIWSDAPRSTGDAIVQRQVRMMRIASVLIPAGFLIMLAFVPSFHR